MIAPLLSLSCVLLVIVLLPWQEQGMRIVIASNAGNLNDSSDPKPKTLKPNPQAPKNLKHQTKAETVDPFEHVAIKPEFLNPNHWKVSSEPLGQHRCVAVKLWA